MSTEFRTSKKNTIITIIFLALSEIHPCMQLRLNNNNYHKSDNPIKQLVGMYKYRNGGNKLYILSSSDHSERQVNIGFREDVMPCPQSFFP